LSIVTALPKLPFLRFPFSVLPFPIQALLARVLWWVVVEVRQRAIRVGWVGFPALSVGWVGGAFTVSFVSSRLICRCRS
jgi:hypothetical protein